MSRYISYSLWGDNKVYTYGMVENVLLAAQYYPEWTVRVHYNNTVPDNIIEWLGKQSNVMLIEHRDSDRKASNMFWRFSDIFLPNSTVIVRDADSRISQREVDLVKEWLDSDKDFHIVRDHRYHTVPIMGGFFGVRNNVLDYILTPNGGTSINAVNFNFIKGKDIFQQIVNSISDSSNRYNIDQIFLARFIYPHVALRSMIHASHNKYEPFVISISIEEVNFCGSIVTDTPIASKIFNDPDVSFSRVACADIW